MSAVARVGTQGRAAFLSEVSEEELPVGARSREITCAKCNLRETCLSADIPLEDLQRVEKIVYARRRIKRGERLFSAGDTFLGLYAIRTGSFKTTIVDYEGREQVTGFFITGELLGMGGLASGRFEGTAIALEDSDVCAMPYVLIEEIGREVPSLQRSLHLVLSREIVRDHGVMLLLGSMSAQERLAAFLINLSKRYLRRGYSSSNFILRMTRDEIGSYLGLKLETVSRLFSNFHQRGLLEVQQREIRIVDIIGLERVLASPPAGAVTGVRQFAQMFDPGQR
jgi:CRP/FNR family transcriptional regulator, anaerobic regulatory protein